MDDKHTTKTESIKFSGSAGEFFGIRFVNGLLNMITLGIYSPWAKVRELQYLYGNTDLAGGDFQFTADPKRMLISRLIAMALFVTYIFVENFPTTEALIAYAALMVAFLIFSPIITVFMMSFRLRHSRWRGINFRFHNDFKGAYRVYLAPMSLIMLSLACLALPFNSEMVEDFLGMTAHERFYDEWQAEQSQAETTYQETDDLDSYSGNEEPTYINPHFFWPSGILLLLFFALVPYFDFINMRFLVRNTHFGTAACRYRAGLNEFYRIYAVLLAAIALLALIWVGVVKSGISYPLAIIATIIFFPFAAAFMKSKRYNLIFGRTTFKNDQFRLRANVPFWKAFFVLSTNTICVILTLGMLKAWADIRTLRLILGYTAIETESSFDEFHADQQKEQSAIGEEIADVFDIDVAF
ncbi:YjgN family protein [Pseudomaricurvus sp.]|uniref:YjgN family protein n=1 Tax=Pseudomaricurvus sp. TaxID=2004510 RepID=UPI003F6BFFC7